MYQNNQLSPAEAERLVWLLEEASEVIQMAGKTLRFGFESRHPGGGPTNRQRLGDEIFDLLATISFLNRDLGCRFENVTAPTSNIERKLKYSLHNR